MIVHYIHIKVTLHDSTLHSINFQLARLARDKEKKKMKKDIKE